jgi:hypothetical protein
VYVHLLLFQAAIRRVDRSLIETYGPPPSSDTVDAVTPGSPAAAAGTHRTVLDRARYLAEQVEAGHTTSLTPRGRQFVGWLLDAIEEILPDFRTWPPAGQARFRRRARRRRPHP